MITAFVINAIIVFTPGPATPQDTDRFLPIKMSFDTQDECTTALRARIGQHMETAKLDGVRRDQSRGPMCIPMSIAAHYTEEDDRLNREEALGGITGSRAADSVLKGFAK